MGYLARLTGLFALLAACGSEPQIKKPDELCQGVSEISVSEYVVKPGDSFLGLMRDGYLPSVSQYTFEVPQNNSGVVTCSQTPKILHFDLEAVLLELNGLPPENFSTGSDINKKLFHPRKRILLPGGKLAYERGSPVVGKIRMTTEPFIPSSLYREFIHTKTPYATIDEIPPRVKDSIHGSNCFMGPIIGTEKGVFAPPKCEITISLDRK